MVRTNQTGKAQRSKGDKQNRRRMVSLAALALIWSGPVLACGSFQPRPTPTPLPPPTATTEAVIAQAPSPTPAIIIEPTPTSLPELPTPTPTAVAVTGPALTVGASARIVAGGGLNIRQQPGTNSPIVTRLGFNQRVLVTEGPASADGFTWWRLDDEQGNVGWGAAGDENDDWISADVGTAQPVSRSPRVGDRVVVTLEGGQLTVRALPGRASNQVAQVNTGSEFTVIAGPQSADGFIWYQIRSDDGQIEGWAADGSDGEQWLSPLE